MYKSIMLAICVLFFVIGLVTVIGVILIKAASPDKNSKVYIMTVFEKNDRECAVRISSILSILSVLGLMSRCRIIALDSGMAENERDYIKKSFADEKHIILCEKDELVKEIFAERD